MTSIQPGAGWSERLNPRNWTLTWKLVVVGLVPALLALGLGVLRIADEAEQAAELGREQPAGRDPGAGRRARPTPCARSATRPRCSSPATAAATAAVLEIGFGQADGEIDEMLNALRGRRRARPRHGVGAAQQTEDALGRAARAARPASPATPPVRTDQVVDPLHRRSSAQVDAPRPGPAATAAHPDRPSGWPTPLTAVDRRDRAALARSTPCSAPPSAPASRCAGDAEPWSTRPNAQLAAEYRDYQAALTPEQLAALRRPARPRRQLPARAAAGPASWPRRSSSGRCQADWDTAYAGSRGDADRTAELHPRGSWSDASAAAEDQASNLAGINSVILMLGLLVGITIAVLVARALVRSLRVLRTSALDVAERRLPQAVESMRAGDDPGRHGRPGAADRPRRGRAGGPRVRRGARAGDPAGRRPGDAAGQRQRDVRQPVPPQPGAGRTPAAAHRAAGEQRAGPRPAVQPVPARPPGHPDAAQQREPAGPRGHRRGQAERGRGPDGRRAARRGVRGRAVPAHRRADPADGHHPRPGGLGHRAPAGRAAGQRDQLLPAGLAGGHEQHPHRRRLDRGRDRRPRRRDDRRGAGRRQLRGSSGPSSVDVSDVAADGPVRGRPAGHPARRRACGSARRPGGRAPG